MYYIVILKLTAMKQKRPIVFTAIILLLAITSYFRLKGNENIRAIQFVSIFVIGMLAGILIKEISAMLRSQHKQE